MVKKYPFYSMHVHWIGHFNLIVMQLPCLFSLAGLLPGSYSKLRCVSSWFLSFSIDCSSSSVCFVYISLKQWAKEIKWKGIFLRNPTLNENCGRWTTLDPCKNSHSITNMPIWQNVNFRHMQNKSFVNKCAPIRKRGWRWHKCYYDWSLLPNCVTH